MRLQTYTRKDLPWVLLFNVALPLIVYAIAVKYTSEVNAMALQATPPLLKGIFDMVTDGKVDCISLFQVLSIVVCIVLTETLKNSKILLLKDTPASLGFCIALWIGTWIDEWNLLWFIYRARASNQRQVESQWCDPVVRKRFRWVSGVWAFSFTAENVLKITLVFVYPASTMVYLMPILAFVTVSLVVSGTYCYMKKALKQDSLRPEKVLLL
ncbi:hypothetical protein THRCLA_20114 [Thraustotheca clavata]|uniref:Uncharacterized protein n=1 Tax=Thraustotheca clavata TaxID=74557 RepID=A0A1W0ABA4_9STRA|nr:hypothetical protein THRCLA_20114 [Thraustotheca clavata]